MILTPHHAKYFAHDLTRRASGGMDRLSMALFDAAVDLNPVVRQNRLVLKAGRVAPADGIESGKDRGPCTF